MKVKDQKTGMFSQRNPTDAAFKKPKKGGSEKKDQEQEEDDEEDEPISSARRIRARRSRKNVVDPMSSSDYSNSKNSTNRPNKCRRVRSTSMDEVHTPSDSQSTSESHPKTRSSNRKEGSRPGEPSSPQARPNEDLYIGLVSDESSDIGQIATVPAPPKRGRKAAMKLLNDDNSGEEEFMTEVQPVQESSDDEDVIASPAKRRRIMRKREESPKTPQKQSRQEKMDLEEDLDFLQDSDRETPQSRLRGRQNDAKSARREKLELLKRQRARRAGQHRPLAGDAGPDELSETEEEEEEDIYEDNTAPLIQDENLDTYDDDFVIEDNEDDLLGAPAELPLEFSRYSHMKAKDYFKIAIRWLVHNKLDPAFAREDAIYLTAFSKLDGEVKILAGSKYTSSSWKSDFVRALEARPQMHITPYSNAEALGQGCEACNRTTHPATFELAFEGKPYHHSTLEPVEDGDSTTSDSDASSSDSISSAAASLDSHGRVVPPETRTFHVGRFCKGNAEQAHTLSHWRFHLNQWVLDWLAANGFTSAEALVSREGWSKKRTRKFADEVVDRMDDGGEIGGLWRDWQNNLRSAREAKPELGWGRGKGRR